MKKFFAGLIILFCVSMFASGQIVGYEQISTSQQLVDKLNEIARQQHMDETLVVAVLEDDEAVLVSHEAIGGAFNIVGNVALRSNYNPESMGNSYNLTRGTFHVMDGASLKVSSLYVNNGSMTISGGETVLSDVRFSSSLTVDKGNLTVHRGSFKSIKVTGGEVSMSGFPRENFDSGNVMVTGGSVEITGGEFNSVELNAGKLHITGGDIASTTIKGGEPKIKGGIFDSFEMQVDIKNFLEGGKFKDLPSFSGTNLAVEDLLAEGYKYYTWDRRFKPDLPLVSVQDVKKMQVKHKDSEEYTNPIFEEALKADVGDNGTDVKITKLSEVIYSPYRYEIYTERGLCWLSVIASDYVKYSGNNQFVGAEYSGRIADSQSEVVLKSNLDISDFQWIPIEMYTSFDGQGHRIAGVKVKEGRAAFFSTTTSKVSDLEIIGDFECVEDDYPDVLFYGMAVAGLALDARGTIVNCGVLNSKVHSSVSNLIHGQILMAGLIADNVAKVQNSYAKVDLEYSGIEPDPMRNNAYAGGLTASNSGTLENCYFKGDIAVVDQVTKDDLVANNRGEIVSCYSQEEATKEVLNEGVKMHNSEETEYTWVDWIDPEGFPILNFGGGAPTVSDGWIHLKKSGEGSFEAKYTILVSGDEQKDCIIQADTSVKVNIPKEMLFEITPAAGYEFEKLTFAPTDSEEESIIEMEKDTVRVEAGAGTYKAYFIPIPVEPADTVVIENDSTLVPEDVQGKDLVISGGGVNQPISLTLPDVAVSSLTVQEDAYVTINISGANSWGEVTNNGTMIVQGDKSSMEVSSVTNNGVFIDKTGSIAEVEGSAGLKVTPMSNQTVDEGETVTLTAVADASGDVVFRWQKLVDDVWVDVEPTPGRQTRALLRSGIQTDHLVVSSEDAGLYRCIITCTNGTVSTTLTTFATVTVNEDTDEPEDPAPDPIRYYNIQVQEVCDGVNVTTGKNVVREGGSVTIYVEKDEENYTFENFKVYYKEGYYGNWEELKEGDRSGEYPVYNIWTNIYVKAEGAEKKNPTGMEEIEGAKVYTKDGSLFVQTPQREQVIVISMTGAVVKNEEQIGLKQYHRLQPGIYVVRVGDKTYKLRLH